MTTYQCPHCGTLIQPPENLLSSGRYESAATQAFGKTPTMPLPMAQLAPGERREFRQYHQWNVDDVRTFVGVAMVTVCVLLLASLSTWAAMKWLWAWPVAVAFDAGAVIWLYFAWRMTDSDQAIEQINEHERYPDPQPLPSSQGPPFRVEGIFEGHNGHVKRQSRLELDVDPQSWYEFCKDVDAGRCNFSLRAAAQHGIITVGKNPEWQQILAEFQTHNWLASRGGKKKMPQLNRAGKFVVRTYANTPPLEGII